MLRAAARKLAAAAGARARALAAGYDAALQARPRLVKALTAATIGERGGVAWCGPEHARSLFLSLCMHARCTRGRPA